MTKRAKYCLDRLRFSGWFQLLASWCSTCQSVACALHWLLISALASRWELDSASTCSDLDSAADDLTEEDFVHSMQLLRFKLFCFTNNLHNYIMTRVRRAKPRINFLSSLKYMYNIFFRLFIAPLWSSKLIWSPPKAWMTSSEFTIDFWKICTEDVFR